MRRTRIDLAAVASYENLANAAHKAARAKRARPKVRAFFQRFDANLASLADSIMAGESPIGTYRCFKVYDPKPRLIHAPAFPDRVLHHALMNHLAGTFERTEVDSSFACRPGKGVLAAVGAVQAAIRRYPWYVKIDIQSYFDGIDHAILFELLARRFKGAEALTLLRRIVDSYHVLPGKGLPIGTLTSQYFANFYLDGVDRFLLERLGVRAHVRYMDDIIWWCDTRGQARAQRLQVTRFIARERRLVVKDNSQINRSARGVGFCGYRVLPGALRLSRRRRDCYARGRRAWESAYARGDISALQLQAGYAAVHSSAAHGDTRQWRREYERRNPAPEV